MKFETHAVLGTSTGVLLGDIGGIYKVLSFLIGRPAYTHDIAYYGKRAAAALQIAMPSLPSEKDAAGIDGTNFKQLLSEWEKTFGTEIDLPDTLRDCLADDKSAVETATDMVGKDRVIIVDARG